MLSHEPLYGKTVFESDTLFSESLSAQLKAILLINSDIHKPRYFLDVAHAVQQRPEVAPSNTCGLLTESSVTILKYKPNSENLFVKGH